MRAAAKGNDRTEECASAFPSTRSENCNFSNEIGAEFRSSPRNHRWLRIRYFGARSVDSEGTAARCRSYRITTVELIQERRPVGRAPVDGARDVRIAGRNVQVKARTHLFGGLSGHAGQSDLLDWLGTLAPSRPRVMLTHGEDGPRQALRDAVRRRFGLAAELPGYREVIEF
jgi:hypothetical protein